jgi:hypothetical protein
MVNPTDLADTCLCGHPYTRHHPKDELFDGGCAVIGCSCGDVNGRSKETVATNMLLGKEVYEFLVQTADAGCRTQSIFGKPACGVCANCKAKTLEEKVRLRHVQLGWRLIPCPACEGSGMTK